MDGPAGDKVPRLNNFEKIMFKNEMYPEESAAPPCGWVVNVVFFVDALPTLKEAQECFLGIFKKYRRLQSAVNEDGGWYPAKVDPNYHIVQVADEKLVDVMQQSLDVDRPLWRVHMLEREADGPCIVLRTHHCVADGPHLSGFLSEALADLDDAKKPWSRGTSDPVFSKLMADYASKLTVGAMKKGLRAIRAAPDIMKCFVSNVAGVGPWEDQTPIIRSLVERSSPSMPFGPPRAYYRLPAHSLAHIKALRVASRVHLVPGATFPAILLSVYTGALRRYCMLREPEFAERVASAAKFTMRATMPVPMPENQGDAFSEDGLLNSFAVITCDMAIAEETPLARLKATQVILSSLGESSIASVTAWQEEHLLQAMPIKQRQREVLSYVAKHSQDFASVPGPQRPGHIAGKAVQSMAIMLPQMLTQMIVLSYAGQVLPTLTYDASLITHPDELASCYVDELRGLVSEVGLRGDPLDVSACPSWASPSDIDACMPPADHPTLTPPKAGEEPGRLSSAYSYAASFVPFVS